MIPRFPRFEPLTWDDRPLFEAITLGFPPFSDWVLSGLLTWNPGVLIAMLHGNLVIRTRAYCGDEEFFSFFGTNQVAETATTLLAEARRQDLVPELRLIPEIVIAAEDRWPRSLRIEPDRANDDYVISLRACVELAGGDYREHRKKVRACQRLDFRPALLSDPAILHEMLDLFARWARQKAQTGAASKREKEALCSLLEQLGDDERTMAWGLYDDALLVGFSICEVVPKSPYVVHHFMKTDLGYDGLSSALMHLTSRCLLDRGYAYANIEQDLGIPNLRASKLSWRPCHFLRKFVIAG